MGESLGKRGKGRELSRWGAVMTCAKARVELRTMQRRKQGGNQKEHTEGKQMIVWKDWLSRTLGLKVVKGHRGRAGGRIPEFLIRSGPGNG